MGGGTLGSFYLLAFLLIHAGVRAEEQLELDRTEEHQGVESKFDDARQAAAAADDEDDERSSAFAQSVANGGSGSALSVAQVTSDGSANAQALYNTLGGYPVQTPYNQYGPQPGYPSPGFQSPGNPAGSSSSALAEAQANAGLSGYQGYPTQGLPVSGYPPGTGYPSGASTSALAKARVNAGYPSSGYPSYDEYSQGGAGNYPGSPQSSYGRSASRPAEAEANTANFGYPGGNSALVEAAGDGGGFPLYPTPGDLRSSAPAQKEAQVTSSKSSYPQIHSDGSETSVDKTGKTSQEFPSYPVYSKNLSGSSALALSEANAEENKDGKLLGQGYPYDGSSAQAMAGAEASVFEEGLAKAGDLSSTSAYANAETRPITSDELIPVNPNTIFCAYAGQLHYYWSNQHQCSVCACVSEYGQLKPACASCAACTRPVPTPTTPRPWLASPPPPPPPSPESQVATCDPLPTGQPFQNPLNPCQICICSQTVNNVGRPDVNIVCRENHQCVIPPDVTELPPYPVPTPQPLCDRFPANVWFPHPNDVCKTCQCTIQVHPVIGRPEHLINCIPNPACAPPPGPTRVRPVLPTPRPRPSPTPRPTTVAPIDPYPWPSTPAPPPSPLPGPKPHESCRPFNPNVPFDHPWDPCQLCICSEAFKTGFVSVEINCYTKPECCIEPQIHTALPGPGSHPYPTSYPTYPGSSVGSNPLYPVPRPNQPIYPGPNNYQPGVASASAVAEVGSSYYDPGRYPPGEPGVGLVYPEDQSFAQAKAQAEAVASGYYPENQLYPSGFKSGDTGSKANEEYGERNVAKLEVKESASQYGSRFSAAQAQANGNLYGAGGSAHADLQSREGQQAHEGNQYSGRDQYDVNQYGNHRQGTPYSSEQTQTQGLENNQNGFRLASYLPAETLAQTQAASNRYGQIGSPYLSVQAQGQNRFDAEKYGHRFSPHSTAETQYQVVADQNVESRSPHPSGQVLLDGQTIHPSPAGSEIQAEGAYQFRQGASPYAVDQAEAKDQYNFRGGQYAATNVQAQENSAANHFRKGETVNTIAQNQADKYGARVNPNAVLEAAQFRQAGSHQAEAINQQHGPGYPGYQGSLSRLDTLGYEDLNTGYEAVPVTKTLGRAGETEAAEAQERYGQYLAMPASALYPKLYPRPSSHVTPLYVPPGFRDDAVENSEGQGSQVKAGGADYAFLNSGSSNIRTGSDSEKRENEEN